MKRTSLILSTLLILFAGGVWAHNTLFVELKCKQLDGKQEYLISAPTVTEGARWKSRKPNGIVEDLNRKMRNNTYFAVLPDLIHGKNIRLCRTLGRCNIDYKSGIALDDYFTFDISRADLTAKKAWVEGHMYPGLPERRIVKHFQCEIVEDNRKKNKI